MHFYIEMADICAQTIAISKQKKKAIPDWCQKNVLSKGYQMT